MKTNDSINVLVAEVWRALDLSETSISSSISSKNRSRATVAVNVVLRELAKGGRIWTNDFGGMYLVDENGYDSDGFIGDDIALKNIMGESS
jgi:hypothetical protein